MWSTLFKVNLSEAEVIPCGDGDNDGSGYGGDHGTACDMATVMVTYTVSDTSYMTMARSTGMSMAKAYRSIYG